MIKYLILDVDGTLTDGKIYMGPNGEAMKAFSIKDGYVSNFILKPVGIVPVIITAMNSSIVQHRCDELGITEVYQGKMDKLTALKEIVGEENIGACPYFGDDILDLKCMAAIQEAGGIVGCPCDAVKEIKAIADYVCVSKAGEGALREFAEWLIAPKVDDEEIARRVNEAVKYLTELELSEIDAGKKVIVNDKFFYSIQSYDTKPADECKLESHRKYIDIQVMANGEEMMDVVDISKLTVKEDYDDEKDVIFWRVPKRMASMTLRTGDYIVLFPENAHRGAASIKNTSHVLKIVGKVAID
ncbi:MAG: YhcH/YjgK/YiaL family protein [Lachnospiraceae bacterium]|nr:YhcH/YjgK/YiaL family protein [Lachnospiraceae bacterium]